jgi:hypothetical protein
VGIKILKVLCCPSLVTLVQFWTKISSTAVFLSPVYFTSNWRLWIVDISCVVGTLHLCKYLSLVLRDLSPRNHKCQFTSKAEYLLRSHKIVLDKQISDVCGPSLSFNISSGQAYELWERRKYDKENTWQVRPSKNIFQINRWWKQYHIYSTVSLINAQIVGHLSKT